MPVPYTVGAANAAAGSSSLVIPVTTPTAAGDAIFVGFSINAGAFATCIDSQGNVYTLVASNTAVTSKSAVFLATSGPGGGSVPTVALSTSDTITVSYTLTTATLGATVRACSGITPGTVA